MAPCTHVPNVCDTNAYVHIYHLWLILTYSNIHATYTNLHTDIIPSHKSNNISYTYTSHTSILHTHHIQTHITHTCITHTYTHTRITHTHIRHTRPSYIYIIYTQLHQIPHPNKEPTMLNPITSTNHVTGTKHIHKLVRVYMWECDIVSYTICV